MSGTVVSVPVLLERHDLSQGDLLGEIDEDLRSQISETYLGVNTSTPIKFTLRPEGIEEAIIDHCSLIDQIVLYNNQSPYTVGIAVPAGDKIKSLLKQHPQTSEDKKVQFILNEIQQELAQFKKGGKLQDMFPQRWLPTCLAIAPEPFTEANKMLNSTMKIVRRVIEDTYNKEIEFLFTPSGKDILNDQNRENIRQYVGGNNK